MSMRKRLTLIVAACSLAVVAAACSGGATPTPQAAAEAAVCTALTEFGNQVDQLKALDPATATAEDVAAQRDAIATSWAAVKTSLEGVKGADQAALTAAWTGLETALKNIPTDVPIATAVDAVKAAAVPVKAAYVEIGNGINCKTINPQ
jgi:hypothetical protein